jgi:hypothetical protein
MELISLDQPRSLIEQRDEIRPDSPLGILDVLSNDEPSTSNHLVGPLPPLPNLIDPQPVPKLQPPPNAWINKVKSTGMLLLNSWSFYHKFFSTRNYRSRPIRTQFYAISTV